MGETWQEFDPYRATWCEHPADPGFYPDRDQCGYRNERNRGQSRGRTEQWTTFGWRFTPVGIFSGRNVNGRCRICHDRWGRRGWGRYAHGTGHFSLPSGCRWCWGEWTGGRCHLSASLLGPACCKLLVVILFPVCSYIVCNNLFKKNWFAIKFLFNH